MTESVNPEEHFVWALRNLPAYAGVGMMTHPGFLRKWSEHLWKCGFSHRDYLASLADADGNIHVSQLPAQTLKYQQPVRGPLHQYNPAARWVSADTPDPEPLRIPDIRQLTRQENEAMLNQYREAGLIKEHRPGPAMAEEQT
jgi:hypothetical protein